MKIRLKLVRELMKLEKNYYLKLKIKLLNKKTFNNLKKIY